MEDLSILIIPACMGVLCSLYVAQKMRTNNNNCNIQTGENTTEKRIQEIMKAELDKTVIPTIEQFLKGCIVVYLEHSQNEDELTEIWLNAYRDGQKEGFHPIIIEVDNVILDSLNAGIGIQCEDTDKFIQWRERVLMQKPADGKLCLKKRFDNIYQFITESDEYDSSEDVDLKKQDVWQSKMVGLDEQGIINYQFHTCGGKLLLVKIPVDVPWKVFAYLPMGGWNACPMPEDHLAIAKYWQEKYGAVPAYVSSSIIQYWVQQPPAGNCMPVAEEHLAYCEDIVFQGDNLATLAATVAKANVWFFWWD